MQVLQLTQRFPPAIGGVENHVYNLATKLTEGGVSVTVYTTDLLRDTPFQRFSNGDLHNPFIVRRFQALRLIHLPHGLGIAAPSMLQAILSQPSDLLHAHAYGHFPTYFGAIAKKIRGIPLIITPHSDAGRRSAAKRVFDFVVPSLTLRRATRVIALTNSEMQYLMSLGVPRERIIVIPNGVNVEEFAVKKQKPSSSNIARVLFVGRLYSNQKGLETLLQALPRVRSSLSFHLNIVGEDWGGAVKILELAERVGLAHRVSLLGRLSRKDLLRYYAEADLLVLPSIFEPFGIVLLEAMAAGVPVVASRIGGIPEVVEHEKTGLLVDPGRPEKLASAIEQLLSDEALRKAMGQAGRERAFRFSWERIVSRIERVYSEVVSENAN